MKYTRSVSSQDERTLSDALCSDEEPSISASRATIDNESDGDSFRLDKIHRKPESSHELLEYVLNTAPKGSLKNLTNLLHVDTSKVTIIGCGAFSDVYKGTHPIFGSNTALKLFRIHCEGLDGVKVTCFRIIDSVLDVKF